MRFAKVYFNKSQSQKCVSRKFILTRASQLFVTLRVQLDFPKLIADTIVSLVIAAEFPASICQLKYKDGPIQFKEYLPPTICAQDGLPLNFCLQSVFRNYSTIQTGNCKGALKWHDIVNSSNAEKLNNCVKICTFDNQCIRSTQEEKLRFTKACAALYIQFVRVEDSAAFEQIVIHFKNGKKLVYNESETRLFKDDPTWHIITFDSKQTKLECVNQKIPAKFLNFDILSPTIQFVELQQNAYIYFKGVNIVRQQNRLLSTVFQ